MDEEKKLIDPVIFDKESKEGLIEPVTFFKEKSHEEKLYIILFKMELDEVDEVDPFFENVYAICHGRTEAYMVIGDKLKHHYGQFIDVKKSIVITETKQKEIEHGLDKYFLIPLDECISIYQFCKNVEDAYYESEIYFDIDSYVFDEYKEEQLNKPARNPMKPLTADEVMYKSMLEKETASDANQWGDFNSTNGANTTNI